MAELIRSTSGPQKKETLDEEYDWGICEKCGAKAIDYYNDVPVCGDCFDKLDEEVEEEYDDGEYGGVDLISLLIGFMVIFVTVVVGAKLFGIVMDSGSSVSITPNHSTHIISTFSMVNSVLSIFPILFIIAIMVVVFLIVWRAFSDGGLT